MGHKWRRPTGWSTDAQLTLWRVDEWRCEFCLINSEPSLRLFVHNQLASDIRLGPDGDVTVLADRWKMLVTERGRTTR